MLHQVQGGGLTPKTEIAGAWKLVLRLLSYQKPYWKMEELFSNDNLEFFLMVVSTPLKNISRIGNLPQIGIKIQHIWNHHPVFCRFTASICWCCLWVLKLKCGSLILNGESWVSCWNKNRAPETPCKKPEHIWSQHLWFRYWWYDELYGHGPI